MTTGLGSLVNRVFYGNVLREHVAVEHPEVVKLIVRDGSPFGDRVRLCVTVGTVVDEDHDQTYRASCYLFLGRCKCCVAIVVHDDKM